MGQAERPAELLDRRPAGQVAEQDERGRPGGAVARDRGRRRLQLVGEGERHRAEEVCGPRHVCVTHT